MILTSKLEKLMITKLISILETDFRELPAYKLHLIDSKGNTIRQPKTEIEKRALSDFNLFAFELKKHIEFKSYLSKDKYKLLRRRYGFMPNTVPDQDDIDLSEQTLYYTDILNEIGKSNIKTTDLENSNLESLKDAFKKRRKNKAVKYKSVVDDTFNSLGDE